MTRKEVLDEIEVLKTELNFLKSNGELSKDEERDMWLEIKQLEESLDEMGE